MKLKGNMNHKYTKTEFYFLIICILISLGLVYNIFESFIGSFIFASIFAAALFPAHKKLTTNLKFLSKKSCAMILIFILTITLIAPLSFIIINSIDEILILMNGKQFEDQLLVNKILNFIHHASGQIISMDVLEINLNKFTQYITNQAISWANSIANNFAIFIFNYIVFSITIYIMLTQSDGLKKKFFQLSLLPQKDEEILLQKIGNLNRILLVGNLLGGLIQSLVAFIIMSFVGIDKIFFWSLLILICSFIPVLGSSLIFLPMGLYLWITGEPFYAVLLVGIMGSIFVAIENWFKPKFIGGRIQMHSLIILFSMLGGVKVFGIAGIFYGPLITTIFLSLFDIYYQQTNLQK